MGFAVFPAVFQTNEPPYVPFLLHPSSFYSIGRVLVLYNICISSSSSVYRAVL